MDIHTQLKEYIWYERRMSLKRCAEMLGITPKYISDITNGKKPGKKTALKLQEWSDGKFKASDLMGL